MSLRDTIELHAERNGRSLADLSVMANSNDPYRIDTPSNRRDAEWLADSWTASGARRPLHLRGLHYVLISGKPVMKSDGEPYLNTDENWTWLQAVANKARWLGSIPFVDINDERNGAPILRFSQRARAADIVVAHHAYGVLPAGFDSFLPSAAVRDPIVVRQAYRLALIGEKTSLASVLSPIAVRYDCDLLLPTGELSTSMLYALVSNAAEDGRPCRVFYFSDFDPAGYHMPIEVSRKIQALCEQFFPYLDIQMHRCALTAEQVRDLGLPSTPLKETEVRADKWRARWGVEQTEIDALATLRPHVLREIAEKAIAPYFDDSLVDRADDAENEAVNRADAAIKREIGSRTQRIEAARTAYEKATAGLQTLVFKVLAPLCEEIVEAASQTCTSAEVPEADPQGDVEDPLFDSKVEWIEATDTLIEARLK